MTTNRRKRPRLAKETREKVWEAALRAATEKDAPDAKRVAADLQTSGHTVSYREVQRKFARAKAALEDSSGPWHIDSATSQEELDLILPVIASRITHGLSTEALSIEEAKIIVAIRRAMPGWAPWEADYIARLYRAARHDETSAFGGPVSAWSVDDLEAFIAFAHLNRTQPGVLLKAAAAGLAPLPAFVRVGVVKAVDEPSTAKQEGGRHGKKSTR